MKTKLTKKVALELTELIEQWTRAEAMARYGNSHSCDLEYEDFAGAQVKAENKIRKLLFGTSNLIELGHRWGLFKPCKTPKEANLEKTRTCSKINTKIKKKVRKT